MRYGSVCSGIEAATVAWHPLGWEPAFFSEIEPAPRSVLAHHYPDVPCHGDFTTIGANQYGSIDLLVGGTPCQSFSVAGLRGGLDDDRGNLALEFLRLAQRTRAKWLVWENVPGVLSSNGGRDFGSILGGLVECGYGFAYRVLDAQYFGVAQRRRRVFVVGCLGDSASAAAVLFERHSLQGNSAPSRQKGKDVAGTIARSSFSGGAGGKPDGAAGNHFIPDVAGTMISRAQSGGFSNSADHAAASYIIPWPTAKCLTARGAGGGNLDPETANFVACEAKATTHAFKVRGGCDGGGKGYLGSDELAFTISTNQDQQIFSESAIGFDAYNNNVTGDISKTIDTGQDYHHVPNVMQRSAVRRLTPRECERLQGFPDDYTLVPHRNKPMSDGPRYKALGNSMAVPVMHWIGKRIQMIEDMIL